MAGSASVALLRIYSGCNIAEAEPVEFGPEDRAVKCKKTRRGAVQGGLEGDMKALAAAGEHGLVELIMATHAGMTTNEDNLACLRFDRFRVSIGSSLSGYCQPQV